MLNKLSTILIVTILSHYTFAGTLDINKPEFEKKIKQDVPQTISDALTIDAEKLIQLLQKDREILLIDSRIKHDRRVSYIEPSISLPDTKTNCDSLNGLVEDLSTSIIFYCNGIKCGRSLTSVRIAKSCGYSSLYWFRGGMEEWLSKNYPYAIE